MNIRECPIIVRMRDGIVEPVFVAILTHLEYHGLRLHVLDYVADQFRVICDLNLLLLREGLLTGKLGVVDTHCEDLLFKVF